MVEHLITSVIFDMVAHLARRSSEKSTRKWAVEVTEKHEAVAWIALLIVVIEPAARAISRVSAFLTVVGGNLHPRTGGKVTPSCSAN